MMWDAAKRAEMAREVASQFWIETCERQKLSNIVAALIARAQRDAIEAAAQVADIAGDTKAIEKNSTNPAMARLIATVMSDTGKSVASHIRALLKDTP